MRVSLLLLLLLLLLLWVEAIVPSAFAGCTVITVYPR
jgi:hypothetical protein